MPRAPVAINQRVIDVSVQHFTNGDADPADAALVAKSRAVELANANCDRAMALAHKLSAELRAAQERINQLEGGLIDRMQEEADDAIARARSDAKAQIGRIQQEAQERIARLEAENGSRIRWLEGELTREKTNAGQAKADADALIARHKTEADERVATAEASADAYLQGMRAEIEQQFRRLETRLDQAELRADRAEHWLGLIRKQIEGPLVAELSGFRERFGESELD
jgi:hypothetical protein